MYLGTYDLLALSIAMVSSIVVLTLAIRQNIALQKDNANLRRKIKTDKQLRS